MRNRPAALFMAILIGAISAQVRAVIVVDTLVIEQANRIRIETGDTVQRIVISGMKDDPYFHYTQRIAIPDTSAVRRSISDLKHFGKIAVTRKSAPTAHWSLSLHLYGGLGTMTAAPSGLSMWPSFELGVGATADYRPFGQHNAWSAGLMFAERSHHVPSDRYWTCEEDNSLVLKPFDESQRNTRASLQTWALQLPLLYTHSFDQRGRYEVTLGIMANFNFRPISTRLYKYDAEDYNVTSSLRGSRPFTVDAVAMVNVPHLPAIYCKYSPMSAFKSWCGPKTKLLSFGFFF